MLDVEASFILAWAHDGKTQFKMISTMFGRVQTYKKRKNGDSLGSEVAIFCDDSVGSEVAIFIHVYMYIYVYAQTSHTVCIYRWIVKDDVGNNSNTSF